MNAAVATVKKTVTVTHVRQSRIKCVARQDLPELGIVKGERFHLVRLSGSTYAVKKITVQVSEISVNGDATFHIVNNDGERYTTTLNCSHNHTCSCPATGECYHIEILCWNQSQKAAALHARRRKAALAPLNGNRPFSLLRVA